MTTERLPYTCVICRWPCELDDVIAPARDGRAICYRCYLAELGTPARVPKSLIIAINDEEPV